MGYGVHRTESKRILGSMDGGQDTLPQDAPTGYSTPTGNMDHGMICTEGSLWLNYTYSVLTAYKVQTTPPPWTVRRLRYRQGRWGLRSIMHHPKHDGQSPGCLSHQSADDLDQFRWRDSICASRAHGTHGPPRSAVSDVSVCRKPISELPPPFGQWALCAFNCEHLLPLSRLPCGSRSLFSAIAMASTE